MLWRPTLWAALLGHWVIHCYQLDSEDKVTIVKLHNHFRTQVQPSATNMRKMRWLDLLESLAKEYVSKCVWDHNQHRGKTGENLYITNGPFNTTEAVNKWYLEHKDYTYHNNSCQEDKLCGHYTQVVWADTSFVGCATHLCHQVEGLSFEMATMLVCNYSPQGNYAGTLPYEEGESCSKCPREAPLCEDNICVAETPVSPKPDSHTPSTSGPITTTETDETIAHTAGGQPRGNTLSPPPITKEEDSTKDAKGEHSKGGMATCSPVLLAATTLLLFQ